MFFANLFIIKLFQEYLEPIILSVVFCMLSRSL